MELLVIFVAPTWENGMIVPCNTILGCSRIYRDQYWYNSQPLGIYGDPAYSFSIHLQAIFPDKILHLTQQIYYKAMSQTRVSVECLFGEIKTSFKFVSLKS